jgi:aminoglycoside phosphotransferase (APT) family kinase protein
MDNYVAPEILEYARCIVRNAIGWQVKVNTIEWSAGGLFNKVYSVHTSDGSFMLKIECDRIFFSTRKEQIENEVAGRELFQAAGIPCAPIVAYDVTRNEIGVRYLFTERISGDILWLAFDRYDDGTKSEILRQETETLEKLHLITGTHFGSLSPSGILGRHKTWSEYCRYVFVLLLRDGENVGLFTDDEIAVLRETAKKAFLCAPPDKTTPSFVHGDFGRHNSLWGSLGGKSDRLYVIDFGNAYYGLPRFDEYMMKKHAGLQFTEYEPALAKPLYHNNLITDFERLWWRETERLTEDYAHCLDWMTAGIEAAKRDVSRAHITAFVDACRNVLT